MKSRLPVPFRVERTVLPGYQGLRTRVGLKQAKCLFHPAAWVSLMQVLLTGGDWWAGRNPDKCTQKAMHPSHACSRGPRVFRPSLFKGLLRACVGQLGFSLRE